MRRDVVKVGPLGSSFLSCEQDTEMILKKLFISSKPYSDELKRLLIINTKDCLENKTDKCQQFLDEMTLAKLIENGYIKLAPKVKFNEHEEVKSYIIISFDNFVPNANNPEFRDCTVNFDIICHTDYWDIGDYRLRPLKIVGYIDGLLNKTKLSGIGTFNFMGCNQLILNENLSGYTLTYLAIHSSEDKYENDI